VGGSRDDVYETDWEQMEHGSHTYAAVEFSMIASKGLQSAVGTIHEQLVEHLLMARRDGP
jgi:hypothetical protein